MPSQLEIQLWLLLTEALHVSWVSESSGDVSGNTSTPRQRLGNITNHEKRLTKGFHSNIIRSVLKHEVFSVFHPSDFSPFWLFNGWTFTPWCFIIFKSNERSSQHQCIDTVCQTAVLEAHRYSDFSTCILYRAAVDAGYCPSCHGGRESSGSITILLQKWVSVHSYDTVFHFGSVLLNREIAFKCTFWQLVTLKAVVPTARKGRNGHKWTRREKMFMHVVFYEQAAGERSCWT